MESFCKNDEKENFVELTFGGGKKLEIFFRIERFRLIYEFLIKNRV